MSRAIGTPLQLDRLDGALAVCRLGADAPLADWMWTGPVASVTRTEAELSVVCAEASIPEAVQVERGWRALRVRGPLVFDLTGILASLTAPLAEAEIPVFSISTFDTDVILVRETDLEAAIDALCKAGHEVGKGDVGRGA
ncbi:MAG: ACT domain-containing protein [Bacteroidota bacterium]